MRAEGRQPVQVGVERPVVGGGRQPARIADGLAAIRGAVQDEVAMIRETVLHLPILHVIPAGPTPVGTPALDTAARTSESADVLHRLLAAKNGIGSPIDDRQTIGRDGGNGFIDAGGITEPDILGIVGHTHGINGLYIRCIIARQDCHESSLADA